MLSSGHLGKQTKEISIFQCIVGSQILTEFVIRVSIWDPTMHRNIDRVWFPRGPEDDPINVETCRPDNILFLLYIK